MEERVKTLEVVVVAVVDAFANDAMPFVAAFVIDFVHLHLEKQLDCCLE